MRACHRKEGLRVCCVPGGRGGARTFRAVGDLVAEVLGEHPSGVTVCVQAAGLHRRDDRQPALAGRSGCPDRR